MPSLNPFLLLSILGFYLLWVNMYFNSTISALGHTSTSGTFPDGRALLNSFTGWAPLDQNIATIVAFFDEMTNGSDPGGKLLYMDVISTLHTAILWFMLEVLRGSEMKLMGLLVPATWALLWNGLGAGWILPLAIYFHLQPPTSTSADKLIPIAQAKALIPALIIGSYLTAMKMFLSPTLTTSPTQHQAMIALFQLAPLFTVIIQMVLASLISSFAPPSSSAPSSTKATQQDPGFLVQHPLSFLPFPITLLRTHLHPLTQFRAPLFHAAYRTRRTAVHAIR
ncbi:MAG: hypothetical protein Q9204_007312 [Flavoplaca sp. TL-2023a]